MSQAARDGVTRGLLLRWSAWFGLANAALFSLIGIRYLFIYGWPADLLAAVYVALAFPAQFALLAYLPMVLLGGMVAVIRPKKGLLIPFGVLLGSLGLSLMLLDTNVFEQYRFHLSALSVALFDTSTWVLTGVVFLAFVGFQALLAGSVWNFVTVRNSRKGGWVAAVIVMMWCGGQGIHIWADAMAYTPVTGFTRFMPLYFPLKAKRRLAKMGWVDPDEVEKQRLLRRADAPDSGQLRYPLQAMQCTAPEAANTVPNIAIVFIDAMRPDRISTENTPVLAQFAAESQQFTNHYSGGNSSRMGFFSFFYGLPSTYWQSFYDLQRPPVLMNQIESLGYEVAAFSAVGFGSPAQIDRTVFGGTPADALREPGDEFSGVNHNSAITTMWEEWLAGRKGSSQPWFGLLYYDPGYYPAGQAETFPADWSELRKFEAGYLARLGEADADMGRVLAAIEGAEAADGDRETLIIVASDHGYEFDELGLGYRGHASNYSQWQLRSTLLMRWPGRAPEIFTHRSAHQDVPATLLQDVFGCSNPAENFSSGHNLFARQAWDWMIAGSYTSYAIVQPEQLVVSYPGGFIEMLGADYRPNDSLQLDPEVMQDAMSEMRRFFR